MVAAFICIFPVLFRAAFSFSVFFPGRQDLFGLILGSFCRVRIVVHFFRTVRGCEAVKEEGRTQMHNATEKGV